MTTNKQRAQRACDALARYDDLDESNLIDFLADALHWCEQCGVNFERCLRLAREHHLAEMYGED